MYATSKDSDGVERRDHIFWVDTYRKNMKVGLPLEHPRKKSEDETKIKKNYTKKRACLSNRGDKTPRRRAFNIIKKAVDGRVEDKRKKRRNDNHAHDDERIKKKVLSLAVSNLMA